MILSLPIPARPLHEWALLSSIIVVVSGSFALTALRYARTRRPGHGMVTAGYGALEAPMAVTGA